MGWNCSSPRDAELGVPPQENDAGSLPAPERRVGPSSP